MLNYWGVTTWIIIGPAMWVVDAIPIFLTFKETLQQCSTIAERL